MGNYEALLRAERDRKGKVAGDKSASPEPLQWDSSPESAPTESKSGLLGWGFGNKNKRKSSVAVQDANEVNKRRIAMLRPESYISEQFRMLRGRIESLSSQRPIRTVGITSANPGEGKSTASINLAIVESLGVDRRVLIVDCDMRRPTVHRSLGIAADFGLGEILQGRATTDQAIVKVDGTNLDAIVVRSLPANPSELLASKEMKRFLEDLSGRYDRIILDTPATLGLPDSKIVSELCDGVVVVVRAGVTPREEVAAVLEMLDRRRVLGVILNGAEISRESYGYY